MERSTVRRLALAADRWWDEKAVASVPDLHLPGADGTDRSEALSRSVGWRRVAAGAGAGLIAGVTVYAVFALVEHGRANLAEPLVFLGLMAGVFTGALAAFGAVAQRSWWLAARRAAAGAGLGILLVAASNAGLLLYLRTYSTPGPASLGLLVLLWVLTAGSVGLAAGLTSRSVRPALSGLVGGVVGGAVGGLVHHAVDRPRFARVGHGEWTLLINTSGSTGAAVVLACVAIGVAIGATEVLTRPAWITIAEGPGRGRQLTLDRRYTSIGSDADNDLRVTDAVGIEAVHLVITRSNKGYTLAARGGARIAGLHLEPDTSRPLAGGDVIDLGGVFLRFDVRERR